MAEAPPPRSPLAALAGARPAAAAAGAEDVAHAGAEDVALAERGPHMRLALRLEPAVAGARDAVRAVLGLAPPLAPNTAAAAAGRAVLWLGPDEWLATGPFDERATRARAPGGARRPPPRRRRRERPERRARAFRRADAGGPGEGMPPRSPPPVVRPRRLRADDPRQGAGSPVPARRPAGLRDRRAQFLRRLSRDLAPRRHGRIPGRGVLKRRS